MKRKKLEDYFHLYLGCRLMIGEGTYADNSPHVFNAHLRDVQDGKGLPIKLILRPLSSMTEEERKELTEYCNHKIDCARWTLWTLSKSFDLFGLIESGLAVNAETLK